MLNLNIKYETMKFDIFETTDYYKIVVNKYKPVIDFSSHNTETKISEIPSILSEYEFEIKNSGDGLQMFFTFEISSHILGLGEKAYGIDRKRKKFLSVNTDPNGYSRNKDPIYLPIPFFVQIFNGKALGVFINYPGELKFDFGVEIYNKTSITSNDRALEIFVFKSRTVHEIVEAYFRLTGKPFLPPEWSIGHTISRYSYYPKNEVIKILDEYAKVAPVEAVYLDIHYMDGYRLFTWNQDIFGDTQNFLEQVHKRGAKIVTIVDPSIKSDQNYKIFREGLGHYIETPNEDIYYQKMWPGDSVFPDFLNLSTRNFWKECVKKWLSQGVDGIWLDMNEPTILTESHLMDGNAIHHLDNGEKIQHSKVRNSYPYYQNMATFEAFKELSKTPFILSRSGYAGIQKFAAVWTGDNIASWDDIKLQISIVTSLSISGVSVTGCDLGGFFGDTPPEMTSAYYRMALFFPIYRNHKIINGNDQEIFLFPSNVRKEIVESIDLRYDFLDYIYSMLYRSHKEGVPSVSPLAYEFPDDNDAYYIEDEYMLGSGLLYAPQIYEGKQSRTVYLPSGTWIDFWNRKIINGPIYINESQKYPIYIKKDSCIVYRKKVMVYGTGRFLLYLSGNEIIINSDGEKVETDSEIHGYSVELTVTSPSSHSRS
jgi:alpha-glucosidase